MRYRADQEGHVITDDPARIRARIGLIFLGVLFVPFAVAVAVLWAFGTIYGG